MYRVLDIAGMLAILYTLGYLLMVSMLYFVEIPMANKEPLLQLFGLMSAIQMALISFYFGGSKVNETTQETIVASKVKTDAAMLEIAKAAPFPSTEHVVTPAPMNPETGVIPAVEVVDPKNLKKDKP